MYAELYGNIQKHGIKSLCDNKIGSYKREPKTTTPDNFRNDETCPRHVQIDGSYVRTLSGTKSG